MNIIREARAGTQSPEDIYIEVKPSENGGIQIQLESIVIKQFGKQIRETIKEVVKNLNIDNICIIAKDKGALDYVVRARTETAIKRANHEVIT